MPGAHSPAQRWLLAGFAAVGRSLRQHRIDVAVICGAEEEGLGAALAQEIEVPLIAGPDMLSLMDLLATSQWSF
jgi:ADP-heptose:LPS heptosyltransferase